ncbi:MAG: soxD [Caulobacteraceae bacterium]|jgi:heterotetrameric sarcosine oxidase delta subunit|nr:soxD [Caulobacteraceae bacterium]
MMLIACPHCGPRAHVEFAYERTMDAILPLDTTPEDAARILYQRENPRGFSDELWRHTHGCRAWLRLTRHTGTHEITAVVPWPAVGTGA